MISCGRTVSWEKNPTNDLLPTRDVVFGAQKYNIEVQICNVFDHCGNSSEFSFHYFEGLKYMLSNQVFDNRSLKSDAGKNQSYLTKLSDLSTPCSLFKKLLCWAEFDTTFFHTTVQFIQKLFDWLKSICKQTQWTRPEHICHLRYLSM